MTNFLSFDVAGVNLSWQMTLAAVVAAQFALIALVAVIAPVKIRKVLAISTAVLAIGWGIAFDAKSLMNSDTKATEASTIGSARVHEGSCAQIRNEMTGDEVRKKLGVPDEVRNDDKVRGPGSTVLIYRDLRCAVHLFDERVELVD